MQRQYSVAELDDLRNALRNKCLWDWYAGPIGTAVANSYRADELERIIEERVRTHISLGHTAEDLYASEVNARPDGRTEPLRFCKVVSHRLLNDK